MYNKNCLVKFVSTSKRKYSVKFTNLSAIFLASRKNLKHKCFIIFFSGFWLAVKIYGN